MYPLIRTPAHLDRVIAEIENAPGIVLFTLVDPDLSRRLEESCEASGSPCLSVLGPILTLFKSYLGQNSTPRAGAQHMLNADYFKRIDALNFSMMSDDGQLPENLEHADIVLVGVSRTSKTPTSIYLANRGYKTANIPLVPNVPYRTHLPFCDTLLLSVWLHQPIALCGYEQIACSPSMPTPGLTTSIGSRWWRKSQPRAASLQSVAGRQSMFRAGRLRKLPPRCSTSIAPIA